MDGKLMRLRVAEARVGRLATVGAEGRPHLVPICFALGADLIYSAVDDKPKATSQLQRLANIRSHPAAELLVDHYEEDWSRLWWVRVGGPAAVVEAGPELELALDLLAAKYRQYRERRPGGPVIRVAAERWSGWSGG